MPIFTNWIYDYPGFFKGQLAWYQQTTKYNKKSEREQEVFCM